MGALEEQFADRFLCSKCQHSHAKVRRFAAPGSGISRFLDWQHNEFLTVSCIHCGFTEMYDPRAFKDKRKTMEILDLIFGLGD